MGTVHVGIRHDDDLAVTQLRQIKFIPDAAAQSGDDRHQLVVAVDLVQPGLFHVEHLAPQGEDRLEFAVPPALGGAAGGIALDDIDLRVRPDVPDWQSASLPGRAARFQRGFSSAPAPWPSGRPPVARAAADGFFKDGPGRGRVLLQISGTACH